MPLIFLLCASGSGQSIPPQRGAYLSFDVGFGIQIVFPSHAKVYENKGPLAVRTFAKCKEATFFVTTVKTDKKLSIATISEKARAGLAKSYSVSLDLIKESSFQNPKAKNKLMFYVAKKDKMKRGFCVAVFRTAKYDVLYQAVWHPLDPKSDAMVRTSIASIVPGLK